MKLSIGFSSCPNDTYIFDALINKRIDTCGIDFDVHIADVEELNARALNAELDVTKLSYHAFAHANGAYKILDSGSALGFANGPLFIKNQNKEITKDSKIVLPGKNTTAHLLFSIAYPNYANKEFMIFSDIENAIKTEQADAGVIIHENRFTYAERGFEKICDLGEFWEQESNCPIPLGAIAIKSNLNEKVQHLVNKLIRESIEYANQNPQDSKFYIKKYAQELSEDVIAKHINLFVNEYSVNLGDWGKNAICTLFEKASKVGIIPKLNLKSIFLNP